MIRLLSASPQAGGVLSGENDEMKEGVGSAGAACH